MELTEKDREYLKSIGYLPEDLWRIEGTTWHGKVTLYQKAGEKNKKAQNLSQKSYGVVGARNVSVWNCPCDVSQFVLQRMRRRKHNID